MSATYLGSVVFPGVASNNFVVTVLLHHPDQVENPRRHSRLLRWVPMSCCFLSQGQVSSEATKCLTTGIGTIR